MKHWTELNELESAIIRVGEFKNLFKLLVAGTENYVDIKVLQSAIYTMEGMIDDIDSTLYEKFQTIFDAVRDEETEGGEEEFGFDTLKEEYEFNTTAETFSGIDGLTVGGISSFSYPYTFSAANNTMAYSYQQPKPTVTITGMNAFENKSTTTSEEDEAFKDLEKAIKNWKNTAP